MADIRYMVDTDWVIDYLHEIPEVVERLNALLPEGIGLSIVSLAELFDGVLGSATRWEDERVLRAFLDFVEIIPLDEEACLIFAAERIRLRAAGMPIGDMDLLIGATAIRRNVPLLTNNRRHFGRLRDLTVVSV